MAWRHLHIGQILDSIGYLISFDFMRTLTKNTFNFIGGWMGRVARAKREVITKRLRRRRKRLEACNMVKRGPCKCSCVKCSSYRYVQRKRVLEPDYLANLAYQQRISHDDVSPDEENEPDSPGAEVGKTQDHRDLQQSEYDGVVWWTDVNNRVIMPPLLDLPTRSNCSSTSGFRSASPDNVESSETSMTSDSSESSDYQSCWEDSSSPRTIRMSSKSEPRVRGLDTERSRTTRTSRSASMPLGHSPNHQATSQLASKATDMHRRMKRPVSSNKTTSHVCDSFSTCVKCSKIASKPCKRFTR